MRVRRPNRRRFVTMPIWPLNSARRSNHSAQVLGGDLTKLVLWISPNWARQNNSPTPCSATPLSISLYSWHKLLVGDFLFVCWIERFEFGSSRDHVGKVEILEEHEREAWLAVAPRLHLQLQRRARTHGVFDVDAGLLADRRDQIGLPESLKVCPRNGVDQRERARARAGAAPGAARAKPAAPAIRRRRDSRAPPSSGNAWRRVRFSMIAS